MKKILIACALTALTAVSNAQMFVPAPSDAEHTRMMLAAFKSGQNFDYDKFFEERQIRKANVAAIKEGREPTKLAPNLAIYMPYQPPGTYTWHYGAEGRETYRQQRLKKQQLVSFYYNEEFYDHQYTPMEMEHMVAKHLEWSTNGKVGPQPYVPPFNMNNVYFMSSRDHISVQATRLYLEGTRRDETALRFGTYVYPPDYMIYLQAMFNPSAIDIVRIGVMRDAHLGRLPSKHEHKRMAHGSIPHPKIPPVVDAFADEFRTIREDAARMHTRKYEEESMRARQQGLDSPVRTTRTISDEARARGGECARLADRFDHGTAWRGHRSNATRQNLNQMIREGC